MPPEAAEKVRERRHKALGKPSLDGRVGRADTPHIEAPRMRQADPFQASSHDYHSKFPYAALVFILLFLLETASCGGNSCIIAVWNFGGTISTGNGSCSLTTTANGSTTLRLSAAEVPSHAPLAPNLQHVFVTLRGIEANPSESTAAEDSAEWQELAPELAQQPRQLDLMAPSESSCQRVPTWRATVPANQYRQLRLRLATDSQDAGNLAAAENKCGTAGIHCVVTANGEVRPLMFGSAAGELRIPADQIAEGGFRVLPDAETNLAIQLESFASTAVPAGEAVRIAPVFMVVPAHACDSSLATDN